jgi:hypothetical protein
MKSGATPAPPLFGQNENDALMRAMGSKGYDPMPPSQHAFYMDRHQPLSNRVVAAVYQCTIRRGKGGKRSPVGRDERGEFLSVPEIAKRLKVTVSNCWVAVREAEADNRLRVDEEGRIWLGGTVREPQFPDGEDMAKEDEGRICTNSLPGPILLFLKTLPPDEAHRATREYLEADERWKLRKADAMALLRAQEDADKQALLERYGYKEDAKPGGRPRVDKTRQYSVSIEFVQNGNGHCVQNSESNSAQFENGSVQIPHPYTESYRELQRESSSSSKSTPAQKPASEADTESTPTTETPPEKSKSKIVFEALGRYGTPDHELVKWLRKACRHNYPEATDEQIVDFIHKKAKQLPSNVRNPMGWFREVVPKCFDGFDPNAPKQPQTLQEFIAAKKAAGEL